MLDGKPIVNGLSIDVEDYFQVAALAPYIGRDEWEIRQCRVKPNVERILDRLEAGNAQATFFVLGWVAERFPQLVRRIVECGHELASHGYGHQRATEQSREAFLSDIRRAKVLLEDVAGVEVTGYRAARFSFRPSSGLLEVPIATVRVFDRNLPAGGGGYFRLLPYWLSRWALQRINRVDGRPAMFYFHPWEIDPGQPRVPGLDFKTRFRHYINLSRTERRLCLLLRDFRWGRADSVFLNAADVGDRSPSRVADTVAANP